MAITSGGPLIHSISRAYGCTVFGEATEAALVTPSDIEYQEAWWRNGRRKDLETIAAELSYRGLDVEARDRWDDDWVVEALVKANQIAVAQVVVRISTIQDEPWILEVTPQGSTTPAIVRSHSTTMQRLLHTVDVLLAGIRLGTEQHVV